MPKCESEAQLVSRW